MKNRGGKGSSPGYLLDRNLTPRIEQYALNHDITDIDDVVDHLRKAYKEYQRKQVAALRQMVTKAVQVVQQKGLQKPELQLQARESQHVAARQGVSTSGTPAAGNSNAEGTNSSSDEAETSSDSDADVAGGKSSDLDPATAAGLAAAGSAAATTPAAATRPNLGLNSSLLNMYSASKQAAEGQQSHSSSSGDSSAAEGGSSSDVSSEVDPSAPPAFAPPEVIAAAAARALAAEQAERAAKAAAAAARKAGKPLSQQQQQGPATVVAAPVPSASAAAVPATPVTAAAAAQVPASQAAADAIDSSRDAAAVPAAAGGASGGAESGSAAVAKRSRSAGEAGLGRDSRAVSKKARRVSTAAGTAAGVGGGAGGGSSRKGASAVTAPRAMHYADLGGVEEVLADIRELIEYPLKHPEVYHWLGVEPPRGVLLHGPPGCGKTALAHAIATECSVPFLRVSAPEVVSGMSGESEARLRQLFQAGALVVAACALDRPPMPQQVGQRLRTGQLVRSDVGSLFLYGQAVRPEAQDVAPSIIFIDEIDAIAPKRETAQREMERRIVAQMLTCMDDLSTPPQPPAAQPPDIAEAVAADIDGSGPAELQQQTTQQRPRGHVVVIGATNRPDALDPALRRAGRFDREISLGIPTEAARQQILKVLTRNLRLQGGFDFATIARRTPGFVGADLAALTKEAAAVAVSRIFTELDQQQRQVEQEHRLELQQQQLKLQEQQQAVDASPAGQQAAVEPRQGQPQAPAGTRSPTPAGDAAALSQGSLVRVVPTLAVSAQPAILPAVENPRLGAGPLSATELAGLAISMSDFEAALPKVQPSVRREGFTTKPDATWEDVGSLEEVREELSFSISQPIAHPEAFAAMGLSAATGVLLYGPPGCGKTLVAKAVAAESGANFISIKGPELLNKYVGESERAVRQLFARARAAHPCVLFFDEMDALAPRRGSDNNAPAERLVNQLLTEMDGVDGRVGVYVVAATNRPDMIDPALLRPGRLDKVLYVPLPPPDGRASILQAAGRKCPMAPGVLQQAQDLVRSERCEGFSGADVAALVKEASVLALKEAMTAAAAAARAASSAQQPTSSKSAAVPAPAASPLVYLRHFEAALQSVLPSVSKRDRRSYEAMRTKLRGARAHIQPANSSPAADGAGDLLPQHSGMEAEGAAAGVPPVRTSGAGDDMEGVDDAAEPEDPMKD